MQCRATIAKGVLASLLCVVLVACGLPRAGPTKQEILSNSVAFGGNSLIIQIDERVVQLANYSAKLAFSDTFKNAGTIDADTIRVGDLLTLTVWENVDEGLLVSQGAPFINLPEIQVDSEGLIFVPYVGRIRVSGHSPEAVRRLITARLSDQTPDPQVEIRRLAGPGGSVTLAGAVAAPGVFPIEQNTRTLATMLASAGGVAIDPEVAQITVIRGNMTGVVWYNDIFDIPGNDIALRPGDRIIIKGDTRQFTALGATGAQALVPIERREMSLIEALAILGGLASATADPTGIFVFRDEPPEIAQRLFGNPNINRPVRITYALDLTAPNGLFLAREFQIRDRDTLYVSEAPFVQFYKTVSSATGTLGEVSSLSSVVSGN